MKRQMAKRLSGKKMSGKKDESDEFKENLSDEIDGGLERSQEIECELGSLSNVPELKQMACHNIETDTVSNNTQKPSTKPGRDHSSIDGITIALNSFWT